MQKGYYRTIIRNRSGFVKRGEGGSAERAGNVFLRGKVLTQRVEKKNSLFPLKTDEKLKFIAVVENKRGLCYTKKKGAFYD